MKREFVIEIDDYIGDIKALENLISIAIEIYAYGELTSIKEMKRVKID